MSEMESQEKRPVKRKNRRSSFFQRRLSGYSPSDFQVPEDLEDKAESDEHPIKGYIDKLKKEKEQWNYLLEKIKRENSQLKGKCVNIEEQNNWHDLTEEDKQFLRERPDYLAIAKLADSTAEAIALRKCRVAAAVDQVNNLVKTHKRLQDQVEEGVIHRTINCMDEFDSP